MILVLCGIPAAGKSSILNALKDRFPAIPIVNYGDVMLEEGAGQGLD
jgi:adenylate kinase